MYDYITTKPELNEKTLAHYGIKGMKWRNKRLVSDATTNLVTSIGKRNRMRDAVASKKAKDSYESRKSNAKLARGNAHRNYAKKKLGLIGYKKAVNEKLGSGNSLKTIYIRGNSAYETIPKIYNPSKKKKK